MVVSGSWWAVESGKRIWGLKLNWKWGLKEEVEEEEVLTLRTTNGKWVRGGGAVGVVVKVAAGRSNTPKIRCCTWILLISILLSTAFLQLSWTELRNQERLLMFGNEGRKRRRRRKKEWWLLTQCYTRRGWLCQTTFFFHSPSSLPPPLFRPVTKRTPSNSFPLPFFTSLLTCIFSSHLIFLTSFFLTSCLLPPFYCSNILGIQYSISSWEEDMHSTELLSLFPNNGTTTSSCSSSGGGLCRCRCWRNRACHHQGDLVSLLLLFLWNRSLGWETFSLPKGWENQLSGYRWEMSKWDRKVMGRGVSFVV